MEQALYGSSDDDDEESVVSERPVVQRGMGASSEPGSPTGAFGDRRVPEAPQPAGSPAEAQQSGLPTAEAVKPGVKVRRASGRLQSAARAAACRRASGGLCAAGQRCCVGGVRLRRAERKGARAPWRVLCVC